MLRDSTAASVLRRAVSLVATTLVAISLTFLFFAYTIDQVKAPGRLASALVDHLGALLLHLDMGPSALSLEIPSSRSCATAGRSGCPSWSSARRSAPS